MSMKSICLLMPLKARPSTSRVNGGKKTRRVSENSIRHECVYAGSIAARNFHFMYAMHLMDFPLFCFMLPLIWKSRIYSRCEWQRMAHKKQQNITKRQQTATNQQRFDNAKRESMRARFVCEPSDSKKTPSLRAAEKSSAAFCRASIEVNNISTGFTHKSCGSRRALRHWSLNELE